uniref:Uncharacterized protein n=1 Tax=Noctiluca scintillans TaxID=2966 RepID=A0A7S1AC59_NOCSC|mmetsp:Transcript_4031/g.11286  ORF Transcript_4031/g.11286 Transcript_4031/m.11286 type:complete len:393 (+) Transcript_4031:78-1256(+)
MWWLGVSLEIVSTISGTIGKQLIRLSSLSKKKNPHRSKVFFTIGLIVNTVVGPLIDMAAYSFAPQSLIAPFGGLDVVWNAMAAPYMLEEKLTIRRVNGCVLITLGTVMAGVFGSHTETDYTVEYLEDLLVSWRVAVYICCFLLWYWFNVFFLQWRRKGDAIRGISLGVTAGTIAGNMFCVKASVEIIQYCIDHETAEPLTHWLPYVMVLGAVFFALSNVRYMTTGLLEYEALFMVTVYEGSMIVAGCISGAVVLKDLAELEAWRIVLYWLAVLIIIAGMVVVFSNETLNRSSLASGLASIEQKELVKRRSTRHVPSSCQFTLMREPSGSLSPRRGGDAPSREVTSDLIHDQSCEDIEAKLCENTRERSVLPEMDLEPDPPSPEKSTAFAVQE